MKKLMILVVMAITITALVAQDPPNRTIIGPKPEDASLLLIYYATTPDLQCHFVAAGENLVGPKAGFTPDGKPVYRIVKIEEPRLYLDKIWTYVYYTDSAPDAQGFYSEMPLSKLKDGPHDVTWECLVTYEKSGKFVTAPAYSLCDWSEYVIPKTAKNSRDPGVIHFEFNSQKAKGSVIITPVKY